MHPVLNVHHQVGDGVFEVLSTSGDTHLGGDDFDKRIVDFLANDFQRTEGIDLRKDRQALQRCVLWFCALVANPVVLRGRFVLLRWLCAWGSSAQQLMQLSWAPASPLLTLSHKQQPEAAQNLQKTLDSGCIF